MWTVFRYCIIGAVLAAVSADDAPVSREVANSVDLFSLDLFKAVATDKNVVASPVSVSTLLALIQQGAKGATEQALTQALHSTPEQSKEGYSLLSKNLKSVDNVTLEFANAAFLKNGYEVEQQFKDVLQNNFRSSIANVDFSQKDQAAHTINEWVAEHTHNRITNLVSPDSFTDLTRFVLTNAVYFKGLWKTAFEKTATRDADFYTQPQSAKKVPTMYLKTNLATGDVENLNAKWLELPFQGGRFCLLIILPNEVDGLDSVLQGLTGQELSRIIETINNRPYKPEVIVHLPRFKLASTLNLNDPLKKIGLTNIFQGADFSGISKEPVEVSQVLQKAEMEVNEEGATASAATVFIGRRVRPALPPPPPLEFNVDRPFLAFIVDGLNGVPLFTSMVHDPSSM